MRSTRFTSLVLAFGVGCAGAWAADAAFAQDGPAPRPQQPKNDPDQVLKELERLLEELLAPQRPAPARPVRPLEPQAPQRPKTLEEELEELFPGLRLRVRPLTPEERAKREREMEQARREFEQRMAEMNRRMEEWRKNFDQEMRRMFGGRDPFGGQRPFGEGGLFGPNSPFSRLGQPGQGGSSRSFELGPNGVSKATIKDGDTTITGRRNADGIFIEVSKPGANGKPQTTEYRAKDEAEFKQKYPGQAGLFDQVFGKGRGFFVEFPRGPGGFRSGAPKQTPRARTPSLESTKLGFTADPISPMLRSQLGVPAGQGLYLRTIAPDGWAERAGLEARDVILSVDGKPVTGIASLEQVISGATETAATVTLVLQRQGVRLELGVPK